MDHAFKMHCQKNNLIETPLFTVPKVNFWN